jgi:hypothetical protein
MQGHKGVFYDPFGWRLYCDSDWASNPCPSNKRRSQNGYVACIDGVPVLWGSKVTSVAFAHPDMGEAHADCSSGAAEVYAASNASKEFLHLSYVAREANVEFPKPMVMEVDNTTAEAFMNDSCFKSKLKHIDCAQGWVLALRDHTVLIPKHIPTLDNLADLFTKVLSRSTFVALVSQLMFSRSRCLI